MAIGITDPPSGATLRGSIQVFTWDLGGIPIEASWLYVGSTLGGSQYAARQTAAFTTTSIGDLPTDGSTVFVRLWYRTSGAWRFIDHEYTAAATPGLPFMVNPTDGARLTGARQTFGWNFADLPMESSWLYVGSMVGGSDYAAVLTGTATSTTVGRLPTDESTVHVRLYFRSTGVWYFIDRTYQAGSVPVPTKDELTRELQRLVGVTADGIVGPLTRAALNRNWAGRKATFDPSFATRLVNNADLVRWVQRRINTRSRQGLTVDGDFGDATEVAVASHLGKSGVLAAESFLTLLDPQ